MWTNEEKDQLISLYPLYHMSELCVILNKTDGQIRGMKSRLGLNSKRRNFTENEIEVIRKFYNDNKDSIDLSELSSVLNRPKTSISRLAGKNGLTNNYRHLTDSAKEKIIVSKKKYYLSDKYSDEIHKKQKELLAFYSQNFHPRGMYSKHHSDNTKKRMSDSHKKIWADMSMEERCALVRKMKNGQTKAGCRHSTENTYSRCHGRYRDDIGMYFRSSWEANIARMFTYLGLS